MTYAPVYSPWHFGGWPEWGTRVEVHTTRWRGRAGVVTGDAWIDGGGAGQRRVVSVDLDATARAAARTIVCYPLSLHREDQ